MASVESPDRADRAELIVLRMELGLDVETATDDTITGAWPSQRVSNVSCAPNTIGKGRHKFNSNLNAGCDDSFTLARSLTLL